MSLFGSLMADVEDDPFFGSHMRHIRQVNSFMMNSLFSDPFGMMGLGSGGPLAITGQVGHGNMNSMNSMNSMMPFMPRMPPMNTLFSGLEGARMGAMGTMGNMGNMGSMGNMGMGSYSSSTVVVTNGPNGKSQVFSSSSSTKIGPNGVKETRKTLEDTRTGTKKMSIGHHIGERAHVIEREQNVYTGDAEENQEFINLDEDEAEDFDREFKIKSGSGHGSGPGRGVPALCAPPPRPAPRLALPAPPAQPAHSPSTSSHSERKHVRPSSRRPIRTAASPLIPSVQVREVYSAPHPQRKSKHHNKHRQNDN